MTVLIIVFITLSLIGSVLWIMPPKKERERMALRMHARKLNLIVQLTSIDLPDKWDKSTNKQKVCAYSVYRQKPIETLPEKTFLLPYEVWKYHALSEGWWSSKKLTLDEASLNTINKYGHLLKGIEITRVSISFYWDEDGDELTLEKLAKLMFFLEKIRF